MTWDLFLDDVRNPGVQGWIIARNVKQAKDLIEKNGFPEFISFDHDLGDDETSMELVNWMIEEDLNNEGCVIPKDFSFAVHSANPVGAKNIQAKLESYLEYRNEVAF